jgi:ABC-type protease/lipase transport system fused ATPase/permease subunit
MLLVRVFFVIFLKKPPKMIFIAALIIIVIIIYMNQLYEAKKTNTGETEESLQELNTLLSRFVRQVELHRAYYALKKMSKDTKTYE